MAEACGGAHPARVWFALVLLAGLAACGSTVPPSNVRSNAKLTPTTGVTRDLVSLPRPKERIPVAVYGFRDQTGQFRTDSAYSSLVTQGAASLLVKALNDSGWYTPVEREGLQNLLTERRIIRAIESPVEKGKPLTNLPNMMPASLIIEGGVLAYESNVRTGGKGANYLGIGGSTQYRIDQVTVGLRSVDVRYGQVLNSVSVTKTIYSYQVSASVYKYVAYQSLLQAETGYATNEPAQLAVREAIESAVLHLTVSGIRDRHFELQDPSNWFSPVIQSYLAEAAGVVSEEPLPEDAVIPMAPMLANREPVVPLPYLASDPAAAPRVVARAPAQAAAPAPAPAAAGPQSAAMSAQSAVGAKPQASPVVPVPAVPVPSSAPAKQAPAAAAPNAAPVAAKPAPAPVVSAALPAPVPASQAKAAAPGAQAGQTKPKQPSASDDIFNLYWNNR